MNRWQLALHFRGTEDDRHQAFTRLWREFYPKGTSYLRSAFPSLGNNREDVLQEAFLKLFAQGEAYNPLFAPSTWFYTILRTKALDYLRSRKPDSPEAPEELDRRTSEVWSQPEVQVLVREEERLVRAFLDTLPEESRSLVWLRYREDLGLGEIAKITGRPLGTVKSDFARIRRQLADWWEKEAVNEN